MGQEGDGPRFEVGDIVSFDHTSTGLSAEGAKVCAVFETGRLARESGVIESAFEAGWLRPCPHYMLAILKATDVVGEEREEQCAFVVIPEDMVALVSSASSRKATP